MTWFGRGRGGGRWAGPWPGRGPFSYLPPWQRPGWQVGRGACWWFFAPYMMGQYGFPSFYGYPPFGYQAYGPYAGYGAIAGYPSYAPYQSYRPYIGYPAATQQYGYPYSWW